MTPFQPRFIEALTLRIIIQSLLLVFVAPTITLAHHGTTGQFDRATLIRPRSEMPGELLEPIADLFAEQLRRRPNIL